MKTIRKIMEGVAAACISVAMYYCFLSGAPAGGTERTVYTVSYTHLILLENTRYRAEETKNGDEFSKELASLCDVFVNDAFGTAHRARCV